MSWRQRSLAVRISGLVGVVLGPLALSVVFLVVLQVPALPDSVAKLLLMGASGWMFSSMILVPELLSSGADASSGPSDEGRGGGPDPGPPPSPPTPGGGIPLPDAKQARERVRDHDRLRRARLRRRTREPERAPLRTLPHE